MDKGVVMKFDKPWKGGFSVYAIIIKDGDLNRLYYRGEQVVGKDGNPNEHTCYAELLDDDGNVIPGYSAVDCLSLNKDGVVQVIRWRNHAELPKIKTKLRIKFTMTNTELYGLYAGKVCSNNRK